ncbi:hypothetical protein LCGC14_0814830 [marine sediment metagenome]|uniref:Uncharacterized protein n=1 Tax=marine sediment metagenome TaxID=412755 RepID=A0A0F9PQ68_9ZZZZ
MAYDIEIEFDSTGIGICPVCHREVWYGACQYIRHYQCVSEVEVCSDCKSDFIKINDIFFRGII